MLVLALALALQVQPAPPVTAPVTFQADGVVLAGTETRAPDTRAMAVIIAGSGPTDRDGNSPQGVSASTYRLLAEALAGHGVSTVRYDKRGVAVSSVAGMSEATLRFDHYVDDARIVAEQTAASAGLACVWLIGHSEGALIALEAARDNDRVCGVVLLSGAGRRADVVIAEQLSGVPEPTRSAALHALEELAAGRAAEVVPGLETLFRESVQPYLISWFARDPAVLANLYDGPMMIGQGSTDLQTTIEDAEALKAAQPDATLVIWEGVNHLLKVAPADRAANLATYSAPNLPLADGVADAVAEFILTR